MLTLNIFEFQHVLIIHSLLHDARAGFTIRSGYCILLLFGQEKQVIDRYRPMVIYGDEELRESLSSMLGERISTNFVFPSR